ncbi:MAG TPA: Fic family protein [Leptospiraceae bacterium]|nr:Fic family protein [Leptospiraceae bacterium]HMZ59158.1 Fic family protein [Leptospiraceae bacterium]HNH08140.1 Fic family protein [Leptospiraceae bacterium]HNI97923.1 Fic family protein [Leptospiraceae bacterium]HNM04208.1 Fic family protein [Leptospiraceae bacterium]
MKLGDFFSGQYVNRSQYKSFEPSKIHLPWVIDDSELMMLLSEADIKLGELNGISELVPDVNSFLQMHVLKEGTESSRIEGTQTNIEEALQKEGDISPEKKDDWQEVQNYVLALNSAIRQLAEIPISGRLLKNTHRILMQGVRGKNKMPGEYRETQNWIGGASLSDAVFIPPHQNSVSELMTDLEKFLNDENLRVPKLIKIGIAHYQFETIHPFLDGNGRVGRLLIPLYLVENRILNKPVLYLSDFFEKNKSLYYDNLMRVRTHHNLVQWLKFFLVGVRQTSQNSIDTFRSILAVRKKTEEKILTLGRRIPTAKKLLQFLFLKPVADSQEIEEAIQMNATTAFRIIDEFLRLEILREKTGNKRNRIFIFEDYLGLFR